ncbi:hypothetical protein ABT040_16115 [Streptomyces sp. NPDC002688]|uniref:hypothetical protein n=1 Tax=Streptomyces sp. NPDC002688 TaxID=3154423 RepID=UPI0033191990
MPGIAGPEPKAMSPFEAVAQFGGTAEGAERRRIGQVVMGGEPKRRRRTDRPPKATAMLFEEVSEAQDRPDSRGLRVRSRRGAQSANSREPEGCLLSVDGQGKLSKRPFCPVRVEPVAIVFTEVIEGGVDEERLRQVEADPEAARIHRRFQHRPGGWRALLVAAEKFRRSRKILCDSSISRRALESGAQQPIAGSRESNCLAQRLLVEGIGNSDGPPGQ